MASTARPYDRGEHGTSGAGSGAGIRTPDTRIMIARACLSNSLQDNDLQHLARVSDCDSDSDDAGLDGIPADLQAVIRAWPDLSENAKKKVLDIVDDAPTDA